MVRGVMNAPRTWLAVAAAAAALVPSAAPVHGTWSRLPDAPFAIDGSAAVSVWTGRQLIVFGRSRGAGAAAAYDPAARVWTRLSPPPSPAAGFPSGAVWTGTRMLVFGLNVDLSYDPNRDRWTRLPRTLPGGILAWTGREAIGWGGGCCGDAVSNGLAYDPSRATWRALARSPLGASQRPMGAWDGRELLLFVSGLDPDGKQQPARVARAAGYAPTTNRWRRIAPVPAWGGKAVWDGRELLVAGNGTRAYAYSPAKNRWRALAPLPSPRFGAAIVWTGKRLLLWGGSSQPGGRWARDGFAYDPATNRWSHVAPAPFPRRDNATVAWTGRSLIVWGGVIGTPLGTSKEPQYRADGAAFAPAVP